MISLEKVITVDRMAALIMGGCHTLAFTDNQLVGDPIERQTFAGMKFRQAPDGSRTSSGPGFNIVQIKKYMFESSLKRMSALCKISDNT